MTYSEEDDNSLMTVLRENRFHALVYHSPLMQHVVQLPHQGFDVLSFVAGVLLQNRGPKYMSVNGI